MTHTHAGRARILAAAERRGLVDLRTVPNVTRSELYRHLRQFRPHILHYTGHATAQDPGGPGLLVIDEDGGTPKLPAQDLAIGLQDVGVVLTVLNGCETGMHPARPAGEDIHGICQILIRRGVPAVVATTRAVTDTPAMTFTREFYRSMMDGYPLEAAVSEARKGQRLKHWDWSAWALYAADPDYLDRIRLPHMEPSG
jgi:CHAT domain-containing protein